MVQLALNKYQEFYNKFPSRKNKYSRLPTGCSSDYAYYNPSDEFGGTDGLIRVPSDVIDTILHDDYPEAPVLWTLTPDWFGPVVDAAMVQLGFTYGSLRLTNVWNVFYAVLAELRQLPWTGTPLAVVPGQDTESIVDIFE